MHELAVQLTTVSVSLFHVEASAEAQFYAQNRMEKLPAFLAWNIIRNPSGFKTDYIIRMVYDTMAINN